MKLLYFSWVRERIGRPEEIVDLPDNLATVGDVIEWLKGRGEEYAHAFEHRGVVRAAVDRVHAKPQTPIAGVREIAFFPPMSGG
jgi:molybdopterin synthase sulfur carrier subunit